MHETAAIRRAGTLPAHTSGWLLLIFSGGTILSSALQRLLLDTQQSSQHLVELNIGEMFGAVAAVCLLHSAGKHLRAALTRADLAVLLLCSLSWLMLEPHAVYLGMTFAGCWFTVKRSSDRVLAGLGQVWLALSFYELWSKLIFKLFYQAFAPVEVSLIFEVGRLFYRNFKMSGVNLSIRNDWSVVMLEGCSSFHNLSLTALIWLCVLKIAGRTSSLGAVQVLALSAALVVSINVARILLMLPSFDVYHFWHNAEGSTAIALASVLVSVVPIILYIERTPCPASRHV